VCTTTAWCTLSGAVGGLEPYPRRLRRGVRNRACAPVVAPVDQRLVHRSIRLPPDGQPWAGLVDPITCDAGRGTRAGHEGLADSSNWIHPTRLAVHLPARLQPVTGTRSDTPRLPPAGHPLRRAIRGKSGYSIMHPVGVDLVPPAGSRIRRTPVRQPGWLTRVRAKDQMTSLAAISVVTGPSSGGQDAVLSDQVWPPPSTT
jgi:hypothetical protein